MDCVCIGMCVVCFYSGIYTVRMYVVASILCVRCVSTYLCVCVCVVQLKERCRKGIPSSMRGRAWQHLCGAHELLLKNKGVFDVSN